MQAYFCLAFSQLQTTLGRSRVATDIIIANIATPSVPNSKYLKKRSFKDCLVAKSASSRLSFTSKEYFPIFRTSNSHLHRPYPDRVGGVKVLGNE